MIASAHRPAARHAPPLKNFTVPRYAATNPGRLSCYECLRALELFAPVPDPVLRELSEKGFERRVPKDGIVSLGGYAGGYAGGPYLSVLLEGEAVVSGANGDAGEMLIRMVGPGDFTGHIEIFDGPAGAVTVRATRAVRLICWGPEGLRGALEESPDLALALLRGMARQQRHLHRRLVGVCSQRAPRRLARTLSALFEDRGIRLKDAEGRRCLLLPQPPTRRRMGEISGIARETVSRLLGQWEACGWIAESQGDMIVRDEDELRRLAGN